MKHYTILLRDGFRVGVTEGGEGTPLVFLHGLGISAGAYTEMLELLAANGFRVYGLDLPDHGRSDSLPFGHTVGDMALIVRHALDMLRVHGKSVVVGHSLGGGVAVEYASRFPGNVHTAILLNAAAGEEHHSSLRVDLSPFTVLRAAQYFAAAFRDVAGDVGAAKRLRNYPDNLRLLKTLRRSVSGLSALKAAHALMRSDTEKALGLMRRYRVPTVIVHGTKDGIVPVEAAYNVWKLAGGRIHLLGGRFHSWMLVEPRLALLVIQDALEPLPEVIVG